MVAWCWEKAMRKAEQAALAAQIVATVEKHGGVAETEWVAQYRETRVDIRFPDVQAALTIGEARERDILVSWHNAQRDLNPHGFQSVNRYHFRKASDVAAPNQLVAMLDRRCSAIVRGAAFRV
jgi:hypothetical protein